MVIRSSRAGEVERLLAALADDTGREAAIARLRVIGPRALGRLRTLIGSDAPTAQRLAALQVIDGSDDPQTLDVACAVLADHDTDVALGGVTVLRSWLVRERGTRAFDAITALALDPSRELRLRHAAREALTDLPGQVVASLLEELPPAPETPQTLKDAEQARHWLASASGRPLSALHAFITGCRERERLDAGVQSHQAWTAVRGAAHAALARRGSTVALYDLRESFENATAPLPVDFLTAAGEIGDASCLEPLARAWAAAPESETWWRGQLVRAASLVMQRLRLTSRHATVRRVRARWPGFL